MIRLKVSIALFLLSAPTYTYSFSPSVLQNSFRDTSRKFKRRCDGRTSQYMSAVATTSHFHQRNRRTILSITPENSSKQNFITKLKNLSKKRTKEAAEKAENILQSHVLSQSEEISVLHYASVINCWANIGEISRAETILQNMIDGSNDKSESILPNSHCFSGVMKAYINSRRNDEAKTFTNESISKKCEDLIDTMNDLYDTTSGESARPNTVVYNTLLSAYAEEVAALLSKDKRNTGQDLFSNVMNRRQSQKAHEIVVDKAVALLDKMESTTDPQTYPKPDAYTYSTIFSLLAKCGDMKSAAIAESYLPKVSKNFDTPTYNSLISAWARTGTVEGAKRATALLEELENALKTCDLSTMPSNFGPNRITYFTVISAWVKSCSVGDLGYAAKKAEDILTRMESELDCSALSDTEKILRFKPNVIAYSSIIDCWSKSGSKEASDHVEKLLLRMESNGVKANVFTYTSCLSTYARSDSEKGAKKAAALLNRMKQKYRETGDENQKPTIVSYFSTIDAWARSGLRDAGTEAEKLLNEIEEYYRGGDVQMKPDVRVYARVIAAYSKDSKKESDAKAIRLLRRMEKFALSGDESSALANPNIVCYNTLIGSFGKRGQAINAFNILNQMDQFNTRVTDENAKVTADEHSFNSIIYALSRSNLKGKAQKAMKMLERLENSHVDGDWRSKPSTRSYNMVIGACSNSFKGGEKEKTQALSISLNAFQRLRASKDLDADRYTYISLLKTFGKLLPTNSTERRRRVESIFQECCNDGLVDDSVLSNFLIAAPKDLREQVLGDDLLKSPRAERLPKHWTRKVFFK